MLHLWESQTWWLGIAHSNWQFVEDATYDMTVNVDGHAFHGEVKAATKNHVAVIINREFIHEFTAGSTLSVHAASGQEIARVSLQGTTKMVEAVAGCSQQLATLAQQRQQPFGAPKEYAMPQAPFAPARQQRQFAGPQWDS